MARHTFHPSGRASFKKAGYKYTCAGLDTTALSVFRQLLDRRMAELREYHRRRLR